MPFLSSGAIAGLVIACISAGVLVVGAVLMLIIVPKIKDRVKSETWYKTVGEIYDEHRDNLPRFAKTVRKIEEFVVSDVDDGSRKSATRCKDLGFDTSQWVAEHVLQPGRLSGCPASDALTPDILKTLGEMAGKDSAGNDVEDWEVWIKGAPQNALTAVFLRYAYRFIRTDGDVETTLLPQPLLRAWQTISTDPEGELPAYKSWPDLDHRRNGAFGSNESRGETWVLPIARHLWRAWTARWMSLDFPTSAVVTERPDDHPEYYFDDRASMPETDGRLPNIVRLEEKLLSAFAPFNGADTTLIYSAESRAALRIIVEDIAYMGLYIFALPHETWIAWPEEYDPSYVAEAKDDRCLCWSPCLRSRLELHDDMVDISADSNFVSRGTYQYPLLIRGTANFSIFSISEVRNMRNGMPTTEELKAREHRMTKRRSDLDARRGLDRLELRMKRIQEGVNGPLTEWELSRFEALKRQLGLL